MISIIVLLIMLQIIVIYFALYFIKFDSIPLELYYSYLPSTFSKQTTTSAYIQIRNKLSVLGKFFENSHNKRYHLPMSLNQVKIISKSHFSVFFSLSPSPSFYIYIYIGMPPVGVRVYLSINFCDTS